MFNRYVSTAAPASIPFARAVMEFMVVSGNEDIDMMQFLYGNGQ